MTSKKSEPRRKRGRPTDYREAYCAQVVKLGRDGKSHAQIAASLGVSRQTLHNWADAHPEFLDAITHARDLAQAWFEDQGQSGLLIPGFNAALWAKQVSARFPAEYTDRQKRELTGANGGPIETRVADMSPEQRREEIKRLLKENPELAKATS